MQNENDLSHKYILQNDILNTFSFYRPVLTHPILKDFLTLSKAYFSRLRGFDYRGKYLDTYYHLKSQMLAYSFNKSEDTNYAKSPWKDFLITQIVGNENPLTLLFERGTVSKQHPFAKSMFHDFELFMLLYHFDWDTFLNETKLDDTDIFSAHIFFPVPPCDKIDEAFMSQDLEIAFSTTNDYILENGLGIFEINASFKLVDNGRLSPITNQSYKPMDALVGYGRQKKELIANTTAFINHYTGLNVLLQGDMGTGKSTMVKALLEMFGDTKLKMVEIKKDQLEYIPPVIDYVKKRPYPFIIFIDDLSFDEDDADYKIFKNVLEGSLEENPKNVLIYATSNKRHLVTETMSERDNAVHTKDVMEEKLSLSSRFGLVLTFEVPNQKGYLSMVLALAQEAGIDLPAERIENLARQWELRHLNRSGRTAEQFIHYLQVNQFKEES